MIFQILCKYCGAQGIHVKCGNLPLDDKVTWRCHFCKDVVKKLPPRAKHSFKKIQSKKCLKKVQLKKVLQNSTFSVKNGKIQLDSKMLNSLSVNICPNYEIPKAVKLGNSEDGLDPATKAFEKHVENDEIFNPILALKPLKSTQSSPLTPRKNLGFKKVKLEP